MPHYDELSVKALWSSFSDDEEFRSYFPDKFAEDKFPSREFFFNVLNTVHEDYLTQILTHANKERMEAGGEVQKAKSIEISPFWEAELKSLPYLSQKSGKTIHLLKASSKKIQSGKKRKKIPVLGTIKHYKESKKIVTDVQQQK